MSNSKAKVMNSSVAMDKYPPQIKYIVGNEACERYSYYGMRSILTIFLISGLGMAESAGTSLYHVFAGICYLFPLYGAFISDRFWGKYKTILYLSIVYCVGHLYLAIFETSQIGFTTGLALIALGSGGIKPCVSAHVGDQFKKGQETLLNKVFNLFYFMINFGAMFSTIITPWTLDKYGAHWAFGIPGVLMAIATVIFWMGRDKFVHVPPQEKAPKGFNAMFWGCVALTGAMPLLPGLVESIGLSAIMFLPAIGLFFVVIYGMVMSKEKSTFTKMLYSTLTKGKQKAQKIHGEANIEGLYAVGGISTVFLMITFFWALFDQHGSTWVLQAKTMNLNVADALPGFTTMWSGMMTGIYSLFGAEYVSNWNILPSQVAALNPIMVMSLIPIFTFAIYPMLNKVTPMTPLKKMGLGMFVAGASFVLVALIQGQLDAGNQINVSWQVIPYLVITMAEVMVSITALEFAYTQAPKSMKSTVMGMFLLTVFFGNMFTSYAATAANSITELAGSMGVSASKEYIFFMFFAVVMFVAAIIFGLIASQYKVKNYMEE